MKGIEVFEPERLKLARQMYDGLSKAALAEMVNVSPSTITKWESGTHSPQSDALTALSNALQIPVHWFLRNPPNFGEPLFLNRAKKRILKAPSERSNSMLLNMAEICEIADEWVSFPKIDLIKELSRQESLLLNKGKIEQLATNLRVQWGLGKSPAPNLIKRIECAGIAVTRFEIGYDEMDGTSAWIGGKPYIFIAADKNNYFRSRFDVVHELGHLIMHKNLTQEDKKAMFDQLEEQAHYFSSCFIFPNDAFIAEARKISIESLMMLKKRWGMSIGAMIFKAKNLKLISDEHTERLWRSYRYRGYSKSEPYDIDMQPEQPILLKNTLKLLLEQGGFEKSNIIDKFGLKKHLELLAGLPKNFLDEEFGEMISMKTRPTLPFPTDHSVASKGEIIKFNRLKS